MKNLTVSLDENVYTHARVVAAKRGTSVSRMVSEYLANIDQRSDEQNREWAALWQLIDQEQTEVGEKPSRSRTYADARLP